MLMDAPQENFIDILIGSILISGSSFVLWWIGRDPYTWMLWIATMSAEVVAFGWFLLFVHAVGKFGKQGLWLLLGGMPVLWVMYNFVVGIVRCVVVGCGVT